MKITIAPSTPPAGEPADETYVTISVEHPYDDLTLPDVVSLARQALIAYGFSEKIVTEYFDAPL